jgi:uroporphyrinogen decarboxylase
MDRIMGNSLDNLRAEPMTPRERMAAFASGGELDRLPFILHIGEYASRHIGVSVARYSHEPALMAEAQCAVFREYGPDSIGVGPGLFGIAEAMGADLKFPEDGMPYIGGAVIHHESDLDRINPADPYRDGRLPLFLEALKIIDDRIGRQVPVSSSIGGPLTAAAALRGTENLLKDFYRRPEWVHRLLMIVTESALNYIDAVAALGLKTGISEPMASSSLISPAHFEEFVVPYLKLYTERIKKHYGRGPHLHICGDTKRIWQKMAETGATTISLDEIVNLEEVKKAVGDRVAIAGNVSIETMLLGNSFQVEKEVRECLRKAYDNPCGFIVAPGCALPLHTPRENVHSFAAAVRRYARYPIDPFLL